MSESMFRLVWQLDALGMALTWLEKPALRNNAEVAKAAAAIRAEKSRLQAELRKMQGETDA